MDQAYNSVKNNIFRLTTKKRDFNLNFRDYSREIKSDMVNEMITEWKKLKSQKTKNVISQQINSMKNTMTPTEVY